MQLRAAIEPLRRMLLTWDLPPDDVRPRPFDELATDVQRVSELGRKARYLEPGLALPSLLERLSVAIHTNEDRRLSALLAGRTAECPR